MKKFSWLSREERSYMLSVLEKPMPRGRGRLIYKKPLDHLNFSKIDDKFHILYISYYPMGDLKKKSLVLRKTGQYYISFIGCCIREDENIFNWFDQVYEIDHYLELYYILKQINVYAVHIHIPLVELASIAIDAINKENKIFLNVYDTQLFMKDKNHIINKIEKELYKFCTAWSHKMPEKAISIMRNEWNIDTPDFQIHSLPYEGFFRNKNQEISKWKVVYAGGVMPYHIAIENGHGNHVFDPIIKSFVKQDILFHMYVNKNARNMYWEEHKRYFDMTKMYADFSFNPGYPFHKIHDYLENYHFGLIFDNLKLASYPAEHFKYNMATKFFTYIEAGLPILVYKEAEYMRSIVEKNNIGLVYDLNNKNQIHEILKECDYNKLKKNVITFRKKNSLKNILDPLIKLYNCN